jgi:lipopolysaccharide/colanic/teichoic acid biosynthesis glycosyltransferase
MADSKTISTMDERTNVSSHLHPSKAMELLLCKERMRCDRYSLYFSLIVIELKQTGTESKESHIHRLSKILHKRLRLTDEIGYLLKGGLGVMLPMTELHGARIVQNSILCAASRNGLSLNTQIYTYSGNDEPYLGDEDSENSSDSEFDFDEEHEPSVQDTVVESEPFSTRGSWAPLTMKRVVRADDLSQGRIPAVSKGFLTDATHSEYICPRYPGWKRGMDIVLASIGLILALPIILLAAIAIKLTSKGPVFFRQMRSGQFGNAFPMYKLRTMVVDAEQLKANLELLNERDGPAFKLKNDPRVTKIGGLLRKTGVDELPQLWNVLIGHMAIVGPRPLPCNEAAKCKLWQRRRLDTKPGLTCTWQISKSRKISFSEWMRMDLNYADNRTFVGDIGLIFKTAMAVFLGRVGH